MNPWLEIILPVRNPGDVLAETSASLIAQTVRGFGVVLSDNHSTRGQDHLDAMERQLTAAAIPVRRVRPLLELGRVAHWNWAHAQSRAEWLKPLFVGDLLRERYVGRLRERIERHPAARLIRCEFQLRHGNESHPASRPPCDQESFTPKELLSWYPVPGNWLGGPVNMAYQAAAWRAAGGYAIHLPVCSDLNLYVTLALRHGLQSIPEELAVFHLHEQRFSHGIARRRVNGCFELWLILRQARNYCRAAGLPWPKNGVARGVTRLMNDTYWGPAKQRVKHFLAG